MRIKSSPILASAVVLIFLLTSCISFAPREEGKWAWGQNMAVRVKQLERKAKVAYFRDNSYYAIEPSSPDADLIAIEVEVYQNASGVILVNPTSQNVVLRYGKDSKATPIKPEEGKAVSQEAATPYLATPAFDKSVPLPKGNSIAGWIFFQMPKSANPTALTWDDGDHVVVPIENLGKKQE